MKNKRIYVDKNRDESLTIKLSVGQYFEATFSIDELERILITKLYGKQSWYQREVPDEELDGEEDEV
tara:strand:+ start:1891 stop:2091 length:201 start_codon:yes stop_codon:yes gene_type:complete